LKSGRKKHQITYTGGPIRRTADFSKETLKERKVSNEVFGVLKENNFKSRLHHTEKLSFIIEGEKKSFYDKQKLMQFMANKPVLH
jgi:hypothetical protein